MTTQYLEKLFKDKPARWMHDRWLKDSRVKSIDCEVVKLVVAKVLADLLVRTDTLAVGRPTRCTKLLIEVKLLNQAELARGYFFVLLQRELFRIRGAKSPHSKLSSADEAGYLLFTYTP